jgi:hypothetical protein
MANGRFGSGGAADSGAAAQLIGLHESEYSAGPGAGFVSSGLGSWPALLGGLGLLAGLAAAALLAAS